MHHVVTAAFVASPLLVGRGGIAICFGLFTGEVTNGEPAASQLLVMCPTPHPAAVHAVPATLALAFRTFSYTICAIPSPLLATMTTPSVSPPLSLFPPRPVPLLPHPGAVCQGQPACSRCLPLGRRRLHHRVCHRAQVGRCWCGRLVTGDVCWLSCGPCKLRLVACTL